MKVAVCLYGQPRNWKQGFEYLDKYIFSKYDTDVFSHTWWSYEMVNETYVTGANTDIQYTIEKDLDISLISLFNFKKYIFEKPRSFLGDKKYVVAAPVHHDRLVNSLKSRYYSTNKVLSLLEDYEKENNVDYDYTILVRYDVCISDFPDLKELDKNMIYVGYLLLPRPHIFCDIIWIFGIHKYVFKDFYDNIDINYDKFMNLSEEYKQQLGNSELVNCRYLNAEELQSFHLLFKGLLNNVCKHPNLNAVAIR